MCSVVSFLVGNAPDVNAPLWFLPCLFTVEILWYFIDKMLRNRAIIYIVPVVLFVLGYFSGEFLDRATPGWLARVGTLMAYFSVGNLFVPKKNIVVKTTWSVDVGIVAGILGFLSIAAVIPYRAHWSGVLSYISYQCLALLGIGLVFVVGQRSPLEALCRWGVASMGILLFHKFILVFIQLVILKEICIHYAFGPVVVALFATVVAMLLCVLLDSVCRRYASLIVGAETAKALG